MIYTSLAVAALVANAAIPSFTSLIHMHPKAKAADDRVQVLLINSSSQFRDVKVDGHNYTLNAGNTLSIKAPAGTVIYRNSYAPFHHRGDVLAALTPEMNRSHIDVK